MGENITLTCKDGVKISAFVAKPEGKPKGGMVVLQEIFGVNHHIRAVAERYAAQGYLAVAPGMFDRVGPGIELGYEAPDRAKGGETRAKVDMGKAVLDIQAAVDYAKQAGKTGVVGFCWGGTLAYLAALKVDGVAAAVGYYGGGVAALADQKPKVPTMLHFGDQDHSIPLADVEKIKAARPDIPVYVYSAGHGFSCDERGSFDKEASDLARERTLAFFAQHI
jgi:carboxymethylenebutenolidase